MPSLDSNHADIALTFRRAGAYVIDLARLGKDKPDMLVGFAGTERLVEVKVDADARPKRERMKLGTKCGTCGKTWRAHRAGTARTRDMRTGARTACEKFAVKLVPAPRHGGKLSRGQKAFATEWPGSPVEVVRSRDDVARVLDAMRASMLDD